MTHETAIDLLDAAQDNLDPIDTMAGIAGTNVQPSFGNIMSARAALFREGWTKTQTTEKVVTVEGWKIPERLLPTWNKTKVIFQDEMRRLHKDTAKDRTDDETILILTCYLHMRLVEVHERLHAKA